MPNFTFCSVKHAGFYSLLIPLLFIGACNLVEPHVEEQTECFLSRIQFNEFESLNFQTLSGGRVYSLTQEFTVNDETTITSSFHFSYQQESIRVVDQMNPHPVTPYMAIKLEDDRPVEVIRYFSSPGVLLIHEITYPEKNRIKVDLTREASTGDLLYIGYADYHLDNDGNVVRLQHFRADEADSTEFTPILERFYMYDDNSNPQNGLYLPFFANVSFPTLSFFSSNNILSYIENGQTYNFEYEYGPDGEVVRQTHPEGNDIIFGYANCTE